ncbi:MAG: elongation factor G, partial [bacterium]|nr:elongation factor G [bacterium]
GRLLRMHANKREEVPVARAGEIVAAVGLKTVRTGDTLTHIKHPLVLESMTFPEPVIDIAIEPRTKADEEKLELALERLAEEDPTFKVRVDPETGQTLISGMGELHLEILRDRMMREFKVEANVGKPQVVYRESVSSRGESEQRYQRQIGGHGVFAHVKLAIEPAGTGKGFQFESRVSSQELPREYLEAIEASAGQAMSSGVLAGYELVDCKVTLMEASHHEVDSSEQAFQAATSLAFREAVQRAGPILLEPVMAVEVVTPGDFTGDVVGDLGARRGKVDGMAPRLESQVVTAGVPLSEMFGYMTQLRSLTQGRAVFTMEFSHFEEVPRNIVSRFVGYGA